MNNNVADSRVRAAMIQAELVAALAGRAAAPAGFDTHLVQETATALAAKRRRAVARAWPGLAEALADRFGPRFDEFAATVTLPVSGGPLADGRAFLRWLAARGDEPNATRLQAIAVDLRYIATVHGLVPRRAPALKLALLSGRLVAAFRLPWLGEYWLTMPMRFSPLHTSTRSPSSASPNRLPSPPRI